MNKLEAIDVGVLRDALREATEVKTTKRLMIAIAYANGVSVDSLSEWYGIPRSTIYYWLDRIENESIARAITDGDRPGRPPKLNEGRRTRLRAELREPPADFGYDVAEWTPTLVQRHVERAYGVSYSVGHVRRLLREFDNAASSES